MDETRYDPTPGRPGRTGLRVSDAERDAVVTELGEHFQQGRLDHAEFDERVTQVGPVSTQVAASRWPSDYRHGGRSTRLC